MLEFLNFILGSIQATCNDFYLYEDRSALVKLGKLQVTLQQKIDELEGKK
jgi:hypothetical protein